MPQWQEIPERERTAVVQYIKTLSDRWRHEDVNPPVEIPAEPAITEAGLQRGKALFAGKATCFMCHGTDGRGDGPLAGTLKDEWGHAVRPADFTLPAGVHGGVKLGHDGAHIFKTIMTGVGGTPMPPFQGQLTTDEVWDIVHYEQSLRVNAHARALFAAGLKQGDLDRAIRRIWSVVSDAASRGDLAQAVVRDEVAQVRVPTVAVAANVAAATGRNGQ
jgi:mono/diheme cytochrome c family protein